jgi:hypothetical protein
MKEGKGAREEREREREECAREEERDRETVLIDDRWHKTKNSKNYPEERNKRPRSKKAMCPFPTCSKMCVLQWIVSNE